VIGTGASAIQFVPQIAPKVGAMHVFQRTPPWIMPKEDRAMTSRELWAFDRLPGAHWLRRTGLYWKMESRVIPLSYSPNLARMGEDIGKKHIAHHVKDPALRARLTPDYRLGCKRVLLSNDYYPALTRPNVELVTDRITGIEPTGVRTADGSLREVDAIIYGTGFRVTDYLAPVRIVGRGGAELNDVWRVSPRSYLGIAVAGFPNLFLLMGPNTGLGHNSMIFMIEAQARYIAQSVAAMRRHGLATMEVRTAVQDAFRDELRRKLENTVWTSGCTAWYQTPDGEVLLWPGFSFDYWRRTRRVDFRDYEVNLVASSRYPRGGDRSTAARGAVATGGAP
jgi:cation diffusion facilitator CzcD-associated flavoprotein CzcO